MYIVINRGSKSFILPESDILDYTITGVIEDAESVKINCKIPESRVKAFKAIMSLDKLFNITIKTRALTVKYLAYALLSKKTSMSLDGLRASLEFGKVRLFSETVVSPSEPERLVKVNENKPIGE